MNFKKVSDNLSTIVIIIALVGGVVGANNYFATASDLAREAQAREATQQQLDKFILGTRLGQVQDRIYVIVDRFKLDTNRPLPMPPTTKEELRKLKAELEILKVKLGLKY